MVHHREIAYLFLRLTVAVIFLFYGFNKFGMGIRAFVGGLQERFGEQLPLFLVTVFAYLLPFWEVIIGVLLLAGLFSGYALVATAALMVALTFGAVMEPNPGVVANNAMLALVVFVLLFLLNHNRYSFDFLRERRRVNRQAPPRPRAVGRERTGPGNPGPRRRKRRREGGEGQSDSEESRPNG